MIHIEKQITTISTIKYSTDNKCMWPSGHLEGSYECCPYCHHERFMFNRGALFCGLFLRILPGSFIAPDRLPDCIRVTETGYVNNDGIQVRYPEAGNG